MVDSGHQKPVGRAFTQTGDIEILGGACQHVGPLLLRVTTGGTDHRARCRTGATYPLQGLSEIVLALVANMLGEASRFNIGVQHVSGHAIEIAYHQIGLNRVPDTRLKGTVTGYDEI